MSSRLYNYIKTNTHSTQTNSCDRKLQNATALWCRLIREESCSSRFSWSFY